MLLFINFAKDVSINVYFTGGAGKRNRLTFLFYSCIWKTDG